MEEGVAEGDLGLNGACGHGLERDPRLVHRLHELGGLFRVGAPVTREFVVRLFDLLRFRCRRVVMGVEGLDVEIRLYAFLFASLDHRERMGANTRGHAELLGQLDRFGDQVDLALRHQRIGVNAPQVNGLAAVLNQTLDVLAIFDHVRLNRRGGADDPLNLAPALLAVSAQDRNGMLGVVHGDCVDPALLGFRERLHDFLVGIVMRRERIDVLQVAAMRIVGEQVAAQDHAAHIQLADLPLGQGPRRSGRCGLVLTTRVERERKTGG